MSEEQKPTSEKQHIERPDLSKGWEQDRIGYEKLHAPNNGRSIKEGYQPIVDITSPPPDGGSGVPDKEKD